MNETNKYERIAALKAMALLAKSANDETAIDYWLTYGIADGDEDSDEELEYYTEDDSFKEIIEAFLETMRQSEGLYINNILGK